MYNYLEYFWPIQDLQAIANTQNIVSAGNLILNGTYSISGVPTINFFNQGFIRQVSLTSVNNLSASTFTVIGIQNGTTVVSILSGPNNTTVTTTDYFDSISSISVDSPVNGISAGTGYQGFLPLINISNNTLTTLPMSFGASSYAFQFISNGYVYQIYQGLWPLAKITSSGQTYTDLISTNIFIPRGNAYLAVSQIVQVSDVCSNTLIRVGLDSGADPFTSTLKTQYLQL